MSTRASFVKASHTYTLASLIERQSSFFKRHEAYPLLVRHYNASPRLRTLVLRKPCWLAMNRGRVSEENLSLFVETWRLPDDPFFTIFFHIKREHLLWQKVKEEERLKKIAQIMRRVPVNINHFMIFLAQLESLDNDKYPLWKVYFFPRTLKHARELAEQDLGEWIELFTEYLERLHGEHRSLPFTNTQHLLACMILDVLPDIHLRRWPFSEEIKESFRTLSKRHHPDAGGDPQYFRLLTKAREILLGRDP